MKISSFMAASLLAITDTLAHPEHLGRSEVARRSAMSKRCEANASNFNKKRHEKAMAKRAWGTGNSTVEITTESSYCKPPRVRDAETEAPQFRSVVIDSK
jgi:hypothetical protein